MGQEETWKNITLIKDLLSRIDKRTRFGKQAKEAIRSWVRNKDTKKLGLLRSLLLETGIENLEELKDLKEEFYFRNTKGRCVCGQGFSKEGVTYNFKRQTAAQAQIIGTKSTGESIDTRDYIQAGSTCMKRIPTLLEELHMPGIKKQRKEGDKEKEKNLQDILENMSDSLKAKLAKLGYDLEDLKTVIDIEHLEAYVTKGDESGIEFDIDKKTNTNTFNWFKGLKESALINEVKETQLDELLYIWNKLRKTPHLVTTDEIGEMMVYSHEFRRREADILLAGVKQDLLYLGDLWESHPYIKAFGQVNIDKDFVIPDTKYRKGKDIKERKIRQILEKEEYLTRTEAMGVHNQFKNIVQRRIKINRALADSYATARQWNTMRKTLQKLFDFTKKELADDYKKYGEVFREYLLTQKEYSRLKYFLRRCDIGQATPRENCLRNHHIAHFWHVAPEIVSMYRKYKHARKLRKKGIEPDEYKTLRQEFFLKEDFEPKEYLLKGSLKEVTVKEKPRHDFSETTELEVTLDEFIQKISNVDWIDDKNYQEFRQAVVIGYETGLVPKKVSRTEIKEKDKKKNYITLAKKYYDLSKEETPADFLVTDNFKRNFSEITGVETSYDDFIEMLKGTEWLAHKPYQKFRKELLEDVTDNKIQKKMIKKGGQDKISRIKRYEEVLKDRGITRTDDETKERAKLVKKMYEAGVIARLDCFDAKALDSEFTNKDIQEELKTIYYNVRNVQLPEGWEKIKKRTKELEGFSVLRFDRESHSVSIYGTGRAKKEMFNEQVKIYNPSEISRLLEEKEKVIKIPKDALEKLKKIHVLGYHRLPSYSRMHIDLKKTYMATPETIKDIEEEFSELEQEIKQADAKKKLESLDYSFRMPHHDISKLFEKIPGLEQFLCQRSPEYKKEREIMREEERARAFREIQDADAVLAYQVPKKSAAGELKKEKSTELSYFIRQQLAEKTQDEQKKETDHFYINYLYRFLIEDQDIRKIGQGLGMYKKKTGERVLKAYYSEKWKSYKPEFSKRNILRMLQGSDNENALDKAVLGETEKYTLPETTIQNFKKDIKEKRFKQEDEEDFILALSKAEEIINKKLIDVYSIEGQINDLYLKSRIEEKKRWQEEDDFYCGGRRRRSRSMYSGRRRRFGRRRY